MFIQQSLSVLERFKTLTLSCTWFFMEEKANQGKYTSLHLMAKSLSLEDCTRFLQISETLDR